jgi:hypothetical protein
LVFKEKLLLPFIYIQAGNIFNHYTEKEGILHFAESLDADLIAMSTQDDKG